MHPKQKGELTEQIVICEFLKRSIPVSKPIGDNQPYDLLIEIDNKILKVQCRTGRIDDRNTDNVKFNALSYRVNTKEIIIKDNRDKFDIFAVFCYETNKVYILKSKDVIANHGRLSLNPESRIKKLPLAEDNTLDKWLHNCPYSSVAEQSSSKGQVEGASPSRGT